MKTQFSNVSSSRQRGFSLIELVFVIAIIGALMFVAVKTYQSANDTNKVNAEITGLSSIVGAVRGAFNTQGSYTGLTNAVILKSVSFPEQMKVPSSTTLIKNGWTNDGYTITPATVISTDDAFLITMSAIPESACTTLVSSIFRSYSRVTVNGTVVNNAGLAATSCSGTSNTIAVRDR